MNLLEFLRLLNDKMLIEVCDCNHDCETDFKGITADSRDTLSSVELFSEVLRIEELTEKTNEIVRGLRIYIYIEDEDYYSQYEDY